MHHRIVIAALAVVVLTTSGCAYRYRFETGLPASKTRVSEWRHIGLYGYVGGQPFDLEQACPNGVAEFGSKINFLNWLPALLTVGLYTPRTVYAVCAEKGAAS